MPPRRRRAVVGFDVLLALAACLVVAVEAWHWREGWPDLRPVAIGSLVALPVLVRSSIPVAAGSYAPTVALAPAVLFASEFGDPAHIFPLWAVVLVATYVFLGGSPSIRNPRIAIQVLAGAALVQVAGATDFWTAPYSRVLTGLTAYLGVLAVLEFLRHQLRTGRSRMALLSPVRLAVSVAALTLASLGVAVLRWMQTAADDHHSGVSSGTYVPGSVLVVGAVLLAACLLVSALERRMVTVATLTGAAVAMPWPGDEIETTLQEVSRRGVRARTAEIRADPGGRHTISIRLRDGRHLVLARGRGDVGFRRSEVRLARALVAMAETSRAQATHEEVLLQAAHTDPLSGLWTFDFFRTCVATALAEQAPGKRLAVLFLDLDNFQQVNASLGHLHADEIIRTLGARLLSRLPVDSFPSRFGGDEFVLLFRDVEGPQHVEELCHEVAALVAEHMSVRDEVVQVTCSIGTALSDDADDAKALLRRAELGMRQQKVSGHAIPRPRWAPEAVVLSDLVDQGSIGVAFQPLVDLRAQTVHGYEALVRAHHAQFGNIPPLQAIDSAIKLGILDEVTQIIAQQAFTVIREVAERAGRELTLSINIEYQQLRDGSSLLDWICRRRAEIDLPVVLELSERKIGEWHSVHDHVARGLRDRGVELALDDFGAGNATFGVVSHWDWAWVKIDRAFLGAMGARGLSMLPHVVRMLDELDTTVVLEGIENRDQLELARRLGVRLAQGFGLGRPLTGEEILDDPRVHGLGGGGLLPG